jgi:N-acetylglucosaminyldiphosphoundecaprenol N-acetyl-beta-D-mannosaminyltransferase
MDQLLQGTADAARIRRIEIFGLPLDAASTFGDVMARIERHLTTGETLLTTFINPSAIGVARRNPGFTTALARFDLVLPDGVGVVHAVSRLHDLGLARISFDSTSLALPVLALARRRGHGVALVGGAPGVAERAAASIRETFPGLRIVAALDGYGDRAERIEQVRAAGAEIVVCGMGGVAQEAFLLELAEAGWCGCGFTCGGYLDQLSGGMRYYPAWVDRANLRFGYRLVREPRRLWRRYLIDYQGFALLFARALLARRFVAAAR